MTTATLTLAAFLEARLAEDEAEAREAVTMRERIDFIEPPDVPDTSLMAWDDLSVPAVVVGPERVLAEVAAKRAVLSRCQHDISKHDGERIVELAEFTLRHLASVYTDHADYDESWRP